MSALLVGGLHIDTQLYEFIEREVLSPPKGIQSLNIDSRRFWGGLESAVRTLQPRLENLLQKRESLQRQIDHYHKTQASRNQHFDKQDYKNFLYKIGYLVDQGPNFEIIVSDVDTEISTLAGPQLVVPLSNVRFALNAANARYGSLFDAFYSSDAIPESPGLEQSIATGYNPKRGAAVILRVCQFLDSSFPLTNNGSFSEVQGAQLRQRGKNSTIEFVVSPTRTVTLRDPAAFVGYSGSVRPDCGVPSSQYCIVLRHNGLHVELHFDKSDPKAKAEHPGALKDVVVEAALSTIQDCEDSVTAVDAEDKVALYRNWLGLTLGSLSFPLSNNKTRSLVPDRQHTSPSGEKLVLPGRSLMLIRNVGHHMSTDIVTHATTNQKIPEGFLDAFVTSLIALYDLKRLGKFQNTRTGSIYIVKPKQHGPEEVALTNELFNMVEQTLGLTRYTIKLGLMDEERRTSANLKACLREAHRRTVFINTGFLDRTGDEIHTSFELGPFELKQNLRKTKWIDAYEKQNVDIGLECGMYNGQIGKGMWAEPDGMKAMLESKIKHPRGGATTAWVPSPKAAILHSLHYHEVNVQEIQHQLMQEAKKRSSQGSSKENLYLDDLLEVPLIEDRTRLTSRQVQKELDNNIQGLLGYVVRWIDQGIGCSKVPDINGVGLMEDRATLRISSQHVANWLRHGIVTEGQVFDTMRHMAAVVDQQNAKSPDYLPMEPRPFTSLAFQAALDLVFKGARQPNGYTEFILHERRREAKKLARGNVDEDSPHTPSNASSRWCKM